MNTTYVAYFVPISKILSKRIMFENILLKNIKNIKEILKLLMSKNTAYNLAPGFLSENSSPPLRRFRMTCSTATIGAKEQF